MLNNQEFLNVVKDAFLLYLAYGSRSNKKLISLHGSISKDLFTKLGNSYEISSLGFRNGKETKIQGRYLDKVVDITIKQDKKTVAGVAVKYVMSNYSQNSVNYFEGMLGETANIRSGGIAYFQILILPITIPYFDKNNNIKSWEKITEHNIKKYIILSNDNTSLYMHTPLKMLISLIDIPDHVNYEIKNKADYISHFNRKDLEFKFSSSSFNFGPNVILNDYESFINKVNYYIKSI